MKVDGASITHFFVGYGENNTEMGCRQAYAPMALRNGAIKSLINVLAHVILLRLYVLWVIGHISYEKGIEFMKKFIRG